MSDVAPSFFPTPHEIAGGIRWVREHPVVATAAAAAATAVSVISYLRSSTLVAADDDSDDDLACARLALHNASLHDGDLDLLPAPRQRFATWADHDTDAPVLHHHLAHKRSQSDQDFSVHRLRKDAEDVHSTTDSDVSAASRMLSRRSSPPSSTRLCDDTQTEGSREDSPRGVDIPPTCIEGQCYEPEDDKDSASPQWGWYVSTTPPDEQYA